MTKLVLANSAYRDHTTDEGEQLQVGLAGAGWSLAGWGYDDGCADVPRLLERHRPEVAFVQDKRDWDRNNYGGSFGNRKLHFDRIEALAARPDIFTVGVVKDAGSMVPYQEAAIREIAADAVVIYYHERNVLRQSRWLSEFKLIRTYHSVDAEQCPPFDPTAIRKRAIVTGAANDRVYPLRSMAIGMATAHEAGCDETSWLRRGRVPHAQLSSRARWLQGPRRDGIGVRFCPAKDHRIGRNGLHAGNESALLGLPPRD
jgi:hypothetical protein